MSGEGCREEGGRCGEGGHHMGVGSGEGGGGGGGEERGGEGQHRGVVPAGKSRAKGQCRRTRYAIRLNASPSQYVRDLVLAPTTPLQTQIPDLPPHLFGGI